MNLELTALIAAAAFLAYAILSTRQAALMAAVLSYAAVVSWIIHRDLGMLMVALGIAIVLGALGLVVVVYRDSMSQDGTDGHTARKMSANNREVTENIGS